MFTQIKQNVCLVLSFCLKSLASSLNISNRYHVATVYRSLTAANLVTTDTVTKHALYVKLVHALVPLVVSNRGALNVKRRLIMASFHT